MLTFPLPARRQSGSFLSTGWFTMILALELCEEIVVYGMVSDSYCRSGQPGPGQEERPGRGGPWAPCPGLTLGELGARGAWAPPWAAEAQTPLGPRASLSSYVKERAITPSPEGCRNV